MSPHNLPNLITTQAVDDSNQPHHNHIGFPRPLSPNKFGARGAIANEIRAKRTCECDRLQSLCSGLAELRHSLIVRCLASVDVA